MHEYQTRQKQAPAQLPEDKDQQKGGKMQAPPVFQLLASHDEQKGLGFGGPVIQAQKFPGVVDLMNYDALADRLAEALGVQSEDPGFKPDQATVVTVLNQMEGHADRMKSLKNAFRKRHQQDLSATIKSAFSEDWEGFVRESNDPDKEKPKIGDYNAIAKEVRQGLAGDNPEALIKILLPLRLTSVSSRMLRRAYGKLVGGDREALFEAIYEKYRQRPQVRNLLEVLLAYRKPNEQFHAENAEEAAEAQRLSAVIYEQYGVELNSNEVLSQEQDGFSKVKAEQKSKIRTSSWNMMELKGLEKSLARYQDHDHEHDGGEGLKTVGRLQNTYAEDSPFAGWAHDHGAVTRPLGKSITIYDPTDEQQDTRDWIFQPGAENFERLLTHELAHAHFNSLLHEFTAQFQYKHGRGEAQPGVEAPVSTYGSTLPQEDIAESFLYYFMRPKILLEGTKRKYGPDAGKPFPRGSVGNPCPERYAWVEKTLERFRMEGHKGGRRNKGK